MLHWLETRWGHQDQDNTRALDIKSDLSSWINGLGDCDQTTEDSCTVMLYIPAILINFKNSGPVLGHSESPRCQTRLTFFICKFYFKMLSTIRPHHMTLSLWPLCLPSTRKKYILSVDIDIYCYMWNYFYSTATTCNASRSKHYC